MPKLGETTYKETSFGILPRSKLLKLELEGTKRGLEYIYDLFKQGRNIKITPTLICELHKVAFAWIFPDWAGKFRTIQVQFSSKEAPMYFKVPELVTNICADLAERMRHLPKPDEPNYISEVTNVLAWFQHAYVYIHPFQDYNGRTARMLTIFILLQLNLPPIELKSDTGLDRKRYLQAMQSADQGNLIPLSTLISKALSESLGKII